VWTVLEALVARPIAGRPAEIVDSDGVDPRLGEALRQLLVERVQASHVGHHDHAGAGRFRGAGEVGHEAVAVGGRQMDVALVGGRPADRRQRWSCVVGVAHGL
jgi:hypothetical protein